MKTSTLGFSDVVRESWRLFKKRWATVYGLFLFYFLVSMFSSVAGYLFQDSEILYFLFNLLSWFFTTIVNMGVIKSLIYLARGKEVNMELIFSTYKDIWKYIWAGIRVGIVVFVGYLLLIVPGIIWTIKYMFTLFLVVDKGLTAKEAMDMSAKMTDGVKWQLFGLYFLMALFALSGTFVLVAGLFITVPVASLSYYIIYNRLLAKVSKNK